MPKQKSQAPPKERKPKKKTAPKRIRQAKVLRNQTKKPIVGHDLIPKRLKMQKEVKKNAHKVETLKDLLNLLQIRKWDYLIVGDGSATTWERELGWGSTLISHIDDTNPVGFHGGFSCGTNIVAEMMAYVHPLMWLSAKNKKLVEMVVHIVTDCEYLVKTAKRNYARKSNQELWHMLDAFKQRGIFLRWHWIPRDTIELNIFAHDLANKARVVMKKLDTELLVESQFTSLSDLYS